jgi:formylglycine-generating enzyme required for sulfatase activity
MSAELSLPERARTALPRDAAAAHEPEFPPPWASAWGDDRRGLWADLHVPVHVPVGTGQSAVEVVQRLRWIEAGTFLMGSPGQESKQPEPERQEREGPQHAVRISTGFWLADSACTQALWLAVVGGDNPAEFKGDTLNPVESVSFDQVQGFLTQLTALVPAGSEPGLPTEAQWEYACRAGSSTPFSFGDNITPAQVNYDGNHPYNNGRKGGYLKRTVPVKTLPPNDWGLYEMHGNVWEWCADGLREYQAVPEGQVVLDPEGPKEEGPEARRAVRGGSWLGGARGCRSADRLAYQRRDSNDDLGLRFALRSTSQAQPSAPAGAQVL